jgi:membrane protease YdiL (CAAX protease family)
MSGRDEQDPIHNEDLPGNDPAMLRLQGQPAPCADTSNPTSVPTLATESFAAEPPLFVLPAIPTLPPRAINTPASPALASGDALLDFVRNPLPESTSKPAQRIDVPDDLDPGLFAKLPPSDSNRLVSKPRSAITSADRLTENLRPESSASEDAAADSYVPDFPITPIRPFAAPRHAEMPPGDTTSLDTLTAPDAFRIPPPNFRLEPEPEVRIPNFGHLFIVGVIALFGFVAAGLSVQLAFRLHLWDVKTIGQASTDIHYTLASMAVLYIVSFVVAFFLFPHLWHKSFFAGLQWNAPAAIRYRNWLFAAAAFCFILAIVDEFALPGPTNAPIDKMFTNSAAAWLLFAFGVTVAPFFEEMTFRGFLLPALCTAVDWAVSKSTKQAPLPLGPNGHPQWSLPAMIVGSLLTSLPFAAMHAEQIAHSIGPLVLLYCVSLVLCFARLATRSLAASTLVHASYNFILFAFMLIGTGGFRHLDKM